MHQFPKFTPAWNSTYFGQFFCPSSGVYSLYTQQWYMSYRHRTHSFGAGPRWNLHSILVLHESCLQTCMTYQCRVYSELTPDDGQKICPKHVEFYAGVNLWNCCICLVYYKEICYDAARSHGRKKKGPKFSYRSISKGSLQTNELKTEKPAQWDVSPNSVRTLLRAELCRNFCSAPSDLTFTQVREPRNTAN
jgi:hypothetical protein